MQFLQAETRTTVPSCAPTGSPSSPRSRRSTTTSSACRNTPELERKLGIDRRRTDGLPCRPRRLPAVGRLPQQPHDRAPFALDRRYWESFDFAGNKERQSFFLFPLGPQDAFGDFSIEFGFVHDGGEIIFSLPNGLQGYYLIDARGNRLDKGPTNIVQDASRRDQAVTNGISCMSCHDKGMQLKEDQVRDYALGNLAFPKEARDILEENFPVKEDMTKLMKEDMERFLRL